uniref:Uncharacterized protein n=1 Tax=Anguilla anguilla TaxID=7936 RepID=A0A0E9PJ00_ANGAN
MTFIIITTIASPTLLPVHTFTLTNCQNRPLRPNLS